MNELALFAGAGGGILGGHLLGWRTVCAVEIEDYPRRVLLARQRDGILPKFPIWDDVKTFDGRPWRGRVDVISGGFPCQDISVAGKGAGIDGEKSGLWAEFARIVREVRPQHAFVENSPALTGRGLGRVLGDLAAMGYDARWGVLGADDAGAPHKRKRIWIAANAKRDELRNEQGWRIGSSWQGTAEPANDGEKKLMADSDRVRCDQGRESLAKARRNGVVGDAWWEVEPDVGRVADGVAFRVDRLRALGNGQVPIVAALAWEVLR